MKTYEVTYPFEVGTPPRVYAKGSLITREEVACWSPEDAAGVDAKIAELIDEGRLVEAPETVPPPPPNKDAPTRPSRKGQTSDSAPPADPAADPQT